MAEYVNTDVPLGISVSQASTYTTTGGAARFQLVIDFDDNGTADGILVGEPASDGNGWWLNNAADALTAEGRCPDTGGGSGSNWFGTLDEWRDAFPDP